MSGDVLLAGVRSPIDIWYAWLISFAVLLVWLEFYAFERKRMMVCGIKEIDVSDGKTFERYLELLFQQAGFRVEKTAAAGLHGTDLIISKDGKKAILQGRKFRRRVNEAPIRAALLTAEHYGCTKVMLVTNNFYTRQAEALARSNKILLWNRRDLTNALMQMREKRPPIVLPLPRRRLADTTPEQDRSHARRNVWSITQGPNLLFPARFGMPIKQ